MKNKKNLTKNRSKHLPFGEIYSWALLRSTYSVLPLLCSWKSRWGLFYPASCAHIHQLQDCEISIAYFSISFPSYTFLYLIYINFLLYSSTIKYVAIILKSVFSPSWNWDRPNTNILNDLLISKRCNKICLKILLL